MKRYVHLLGKIKTRIISKKNQLTETCLKEMWFKLFIIIQLIFILFSSPIWSADDNISQRNNNCELSMYRNQEKGNYTTLFSPRDIINVEIRLLQLKKGDYALIIELYNSFGELQEKNSFDLRIPKKSDYTVISYLKFHKASPLTKLFKVSESTGYHIKFYGSWNNVITKKQKKEADRK